MGASLGNKRERKFRGKKSRVYRTRLIVTAVVILLVASLVTVYVLKPGNQNAIDSNRVLLVTTMGDITIQLYDDMPITTANFKNLTRLGIYNGTMFHRVVKGFVIQGGDPTGTGLGDPSISSIHDEFKEIHKNYRGTVAMANKGQQYPNSGSSQFFINLNDTNSETLDNNYSVFGQVVAGMDVVDAIGSVPTSKDQYDNDRPVDPVVLTGASVVS